MEEPMPMYGDGDGMGQEHLTNLVEFTQYSLSSPCLMRPNSEWTHAQWNQVLGSWF